MADWDVVTSVAEPLWKPPPQVTGDGKPYSPPAASLRAETPRAGKAEPEADGPRQQTVDFWISKGAPPHVAAGIADRVGAESGFRPTVPGDGGTSVGLYQHHADRKVSLERQPNWQDPMAQHNFAYSEVTGGDPIATKHWDEILKAPTRIEAARLWDKYFERSAGGPGADNPWATTRAGKWNVSDKAIAFEQGRRNSNVVWMSPDDYLGMTPEMPDAEKKPRRRSLMQSLAMGDEIEAIPTLDVRTKEGRLQVFDQDGRNRAEVAKQEGVGLIPVAIHGADANAPSWIEDMRGNVRPMNFEPVPPVKAEVRAGSAVTGGDQPQGTIVSRAASEIGRQALGAVGDTAAAFAAPMLGAARPILGAAQLASRGAEAIGVPGAETLRQGADTLATANEQVIGNMPMGNQIAAGVGDAAMGLVVPASRIAALPRLAQPLAAAGVGAAFGGTQPVPAASLDAAPQNYGETVGRNALIGAATGAGVQGAGIAVDAGVNAMRRLVKPSVVTEAAARILGEKSKEITPELMRRVKARITGTLNRVENKYDVYLDNKLVSDLGKVDRDAINDLGTIEAQGIHSAVDKILARVDAGGYIPARSAATLWHEGSDLSRIANGGNPDKALLAQRAVGAVRAALNRQIPPSEALAYSAARHQYRDMKIVEDATRMGETMLSPGRLRQQVERRFPNDLYDLNPTAMQKLGRATGETFGGGKENQSMAGAIGGGVIGHLFGGPVGGIAGQIGGTLADKLVIGRLLSMRHASPNAMTAFRPAAPPSNAATNMLGPMAAPAATVPAQMQMAR